MVKSESPDLMLLDMRLPDISGLEVLRLAKEIDPNLSVIVMTGYAETPGAVNAMKAGALDYLSKPFEVKDIVKAIHHGLDESRHRLEANKEPPAQKKNPLQEAMGPSDAVKRILSEVNRVAESDFTVVIFGETGSGKELVARTIHEASSRSRAPFVAVDCGAIPETLLESELFGHEKEEAIAAIKHAVDKTYGRKSKRLVEMNYRAIDTTLAELHQVVIPAQEAGGQAPELPTAAVTGADIPDFVRDLTLPIYQGHGDRLPVSLLPVGGPYPLGTAQYEKRNIALEIPVWDADLCTQCGKCVFVCPHTAIRARAFNAEAAADAPPSFKHVPARSKDFPAGTHISYQVAPEDCTGCGDCVEEYRLKVEIAQL